MPRTIFVLVALVAVGYLGLCVFLFVFQRSLIYFPRPASPGRPTATIELPGAQAGVLVSVRPHPGEQALVYFGGNAEDVSFSMPVLAAAFPETALYLLHYRGYAGSAGKPSEAALVEDALALFDSAHAGHSRVTVLGRSLGSGIAVRVASLRPAARLVLVTPYDSLEELASRQFPYVPVRWLLLDKYESWRDVPRVTAPTLIVAAEHDEVIPRASTERLYSRFAPGRASFRIVPGASHNTISESPLYIALLAGHP